MSGVLGAFPLSRCSQRDIARSQHPEGPPAPRSGRAGRYRTAVTEDIRCVADILRAHAGRRGDALALECGARSLTFAELYQRAQAVAGALAASGVGAQDRIALIDRNGIEGFEVVF